MSEGVWRYANRRTSSYFIPIPQPRKKNRQLALQESWTAVRVRGNEFISQVRGDEVSVLRCMV